MIYMDYKLNFPEFYLISFIFVPLFLLIVYSSVQILQKHDPIVFGLTWLVLINTDTLKWIPLCLFSMLYAYLKSKSNYEHPLSKPNNKKISNVNLKLIGFGAVCILLNIFFIHVGPMSTVPTPYFESFKNLDVELSTDEILPLPERLQMRRKCFKTIQKFYMNTLQKIIPRDSNAVFIDAPNHDNLGDSFIWLGEEIALSRLGVQINYHCLSHSNECYDIIPKLHQNLSQKSVILLHGGGNQGDLYRFETLMRNRYVKEFPNIRIVFLPQSMFHDSELYKKHKDLHLMVRSHQSMKIIDRYFNDTRGYLVPDSAFMIGPIQPICEPNYDMIFLKRSDKEGIISQDYHQIIATIMKEKGYKFKILDWFDYVQEERIYGFFAVKPNDRMRLPRWSLDVGNRILCQGRVTMTDRLHATILSMLLDKPVVVLENNYRKLNEVTRLINEIGGSDCSEKVLRRKYVTHVNMKKAILEVIKFLEQEDNNTK